MSILKALLESGQLSPLSCYFARFIATHSQEPENSPLVLISAVLSESQQRGDVCIDLSQYAGTALFVAPAGMQLPLVPDVGAWHELLRSSPCVTEPGKPAPLVLDGKRLYLHRFWQDEQSVLAAIQARLHTMPDLNVPLLRQGLARLFPDAAGHAPDWQMVATALAATRRFAVISGGPGTGKTTTLVKVLVLLLEQNPQLRLTLAAPTGKAAARMVESVRSARNRLNLAPGIVALLPDQASTLHRLLGYQGGRGGFRHHRHNPLMVDCLVIDEASMIDLVLMRALLEATPAHTRIILLGDRDQLASVEAGNVLGDITGHGRELHYSSHMAELLVQLTGCSVQQLPVAEDCVVENGVAIADSIALLRTSHRFSDDSGIGRLAKLVNAGNDSEALELLRTIHTDERVRDAIDTVWLEPADNDGQPLNRLAVDWAVSRYSQYLACTDVAEALQVFAATRILCAAHEGPLGERALNRLLAERLRARGLLESGEDCHGKPVMITVNDYELGLYNGDIGLLWRDESGNLSACFTESEGEVRRIPAPMLPRHVAAWALTVHKSQGSEFDQVMLVLPTDLASPLLLRELLYTGITRARHRLLIHAAAESFSQACRNPVRRSSGLATQLGWISQGEWL